MEIEEFYQKLDQACNGDALAKYEIGAEYENLFDDYNRVLKELKDLKQDLQDNYRPIPLDSVDMYG